MSEFNDIVGRKLRNIREHKGYSCQFVADHFGISKQSISYQEKGQRQLTAEQLVEYCNFYNIDADEFIKEVLMEMKK